MNTLLKISPDVKWQFQISIDRESFVVTAVAIFANDLKSNECQKTVNYNLNF